MAETAVQEGTQRYAPQPLDGARRQAVLVQAVIQEDVNYLYYPEYGNEGDQQRQAGNAVQEHGYILTSPPGFAGF